MASKSVKRFKRGCDTTQVTQQTDDRPHYTKCVRISEIDCASRAILPKTDKQTEKKLAQLEKNSPQICSKFFSYRNATVFVLNLVIFYELSVTICIHIQNTIPLMPTNSCWERLWRNSTDA